MNTNTTVGEGPVQTLASAAQEFRSACRLEAFLADLDSLSVRKGQSRLLRTFLADLETVHRALELNQHKSAEVDLSGFGHVLDEIRCMVRSRLGGDSWFDDIAAYDPLRCPVGLFTSLDLGLRETAHTGALTWLLNPSAEHGFKSALLVPLVRLSFRLDHEPELSEVDSSREYCTADDRGRLDVVITGKYRERSLRPPQRFRIIVEAKIDAEEGEDQCVRYEKHARATERPDEQLRLVFLSRDGRAPMTGTGGGPGPWLSLSFSKLMALFRTALEELQDRPGFPFLRLYMAGVLKDLYNVRCGQPDLSHDLYLISTYLGVSTNSKGYHD